MAIILRKIEPKGVPGKVSLYFANNKSDKTKLFLSHEKFVIFMKVYSLWHKQHFKEYDKVAVEEDLVFSTILNAYFVALTFVTVANWFCALQ